MLQKISLRPQPVCLENTTKHRKVTHKIKSHRVSLLVKLKFGRAKKSSKIRRVFWQLSSLIANISGTDARIENW